VTNKPRDASPYVKASDIAAMTKEWAAEMQKSPMLNASSVTKLYVDPKFFKNQTAQYFDSSAITDGLRANLQGAATGRWRLYGADFSGRTPAEYKLAGKIAETLQVMSSTGATKRYTQVTIEISDVRTGEVVWTWASSVLP